MASTRELGLYERFSLSRSLSRFAPIVTITAVLRSTTSAFVDALDAHAAIATLLSRYPLLRCAIADKDTTTPRYVLTDAATPANVSAGSSAEGFKSTEQALQAGDAAGQAFDLDKGPLWRVWLDPAKGDKRRVTLVLHHTLCDGTGTRNLFAELLTLLRQPESISAATENTPLAPSLEQTVNTKVGTLALLKVVYSELLAPRLPALLRTPPPPVYPSPPSCAPYLQPHGLKSLSLPASVVAGLKSAAKSHGINTLHPPLYTAALAALAATASAGSLDAPPSFRIAGSTPFSERSAALGHPNATGNYVSAYTEPVILSTLSAKRFWTTCADYATTLVKPATRQRAREAMGLLAYLPSGEAPAEEGKPKRTAWEVELEKKAKEGRFGDSFEVSNLGVLPATGWENDGIEDVYWAQTASVVGAAFQLNPVAVRGGDLTFTVSYREGAVPEETVDRFWRSYEIFLRKLADGSLSEEATFADVARMVEQD
ncbi:hypothetical protein JCM10207_006895 [Rhodosporidiobolus poonsookiae]